MMTKAELLNKSAGIVATLIKSKTPKVEELTKAYTDLGKIVDTAKGLEPGNPVPTDVATGVNAVIERMEAFRSGYCSNDPTQVVTMKSFSLSEFAEFVKTEVDGALSEKLPARTLKRLYTLSGQIAKASEAGSAVPGLNKSTSVEDTTSVSVPVYTDPAQISTTDTTSSAAAAQSGAPAGNNFEDAGTGGAGPAAGNASNGSATGQGSGTPGASNYAANKGTSETPATAAPDAVLATVAETVEKATKPEFDGWPLDMNAGRRKSTVHFGKDPARR